MRAHTRFKAVQHIAKLSTTFSNDTNSSASKIIEENYNLTENIED